MTTPTSAQIRLTYRARVALAERHTPGGMLTKADRDGILRTVANIHRADLPTVLTAVLMEGEE